MKTIFRFLNLAVLAAAFIVAGNTTGFAQDACADTEGQTAVYTKFTQGYSKTSIEDRRATIEAGKQFLEKYGNCPTVKEQADYLRGAVPKLEEALNKIAKGQERSAILKRFDAAVQAKNWDEVYAAGGEFLTKFPDDPARINIIIPLGMIGFFESYPPNKNNKFNNDTIRYAKEAIAALRGGAKATKKNKAGQDAFGAFQFECTKEDCISQLTYTLGYITYYGQNNRQAAVPFLFEVTRLPGANQNNPAVYASIGDYYFEDVKRLAAEVQTKIKELQAAPDADKPAKDAEVKATIAKLNGYAERALEAYSKAYKNIKDDAASKAYKEGIYNQIKSVYNVRFAKTDGVDAYIAQAAAKPLADPTTPVTPISDPEPTTTTGSASSAPVVPANAAVVAPPVAKPAATAAKSGSETRPAASGKSAATNAKAKPAPKAGATRKAGNN